MCTLYCCKETLKIISLQQLPSCTGMWRTQDSLWAGSTDTQRKCFRTYDVGSWNPSYWLEVSAGYSVVAVCGSFCVVNHILLFGNEIAHIRPVLQEEVFSPFYPSYVKRGLIFLPVVRGCNLTQKIFRLFRNISPIISFGTFFTALQEPQFHSSVWRYREHLQKTPGISITAGKTIQNFYFCGLTRNRSTLRQNYLFVCFFVVFFPIRTLSVSVSSFLHSSSPFLSFLQISVTRVQWNLP